MEWNKWWAWRSIVICSLQARTILQLSLLPPAMMLGQGYVFTCVCDSVHKGGGAIPACIAGDIPACLAAGLQGGSAPGGCLVLGGVCCWGVPGGGVPGGDPPGRLLLRVVRILLECILVTIIIYVKLRHKCWLFFSPGTCREWWRMRSWRTWTGAALGCTWPCSRWSWRFSPYLAPRSTTPPCLNVQNIREYLTYNTLNCVNTKRTRQRICLHLKSVVFNDAVKPIEFTWK